MGLFDRLFKKRNNRSSDDRTKYTQNVEQKPKAIYEKPKNANFINLPNDKLQVDFYDANSEFKKGYDTTRLVINNQPIRIENENIYDARVSWYGSNDVHIFDKASGKFENLRANDYQHILIQIDPELLQKDSSYCEIVMKELLKETRVENYLQIGLQDAPNHPCGNYIGGVRKMDNEWRKIFSVPIGKWAHNSKYMQEKRQRHKERVEQRKKQEILSRQATIEKLQAEIDDLSK